MKCLEERRKIVFITNRQLILKNVVDIDTSGSYLRITTEKNYYVINPAHVLYHELDSKGKVL